MTRSDKPEDLLGISAVERDTGLLKETLRVWERRYGFPMPQRDALGERVYPRAQVERLLQFRRLMDQGWRPGKLMALSEEALQTLLASSAGAAPPPEVTAILDTLAARDAVAVRRCLGDRLARDGLARFVLEYAIPVCVEIGQAWARGDLDVGQEHLFTEQLQNCLREAISQTGVEASRPRILLTTFPDEQHTLGLLFAEALLAPAGARCSSIGASTPLADISRTMLDGDFDVLALSFSAAFPARQALSGLQELAARLREGSEIWVGSAVLAAKPKALPGVRYLARMEDTLSALETWRDAHPPAGPAAG